MVSFFEKKLNELEFSDIFKLVSIDKIPESYNLDYTVSKEVDL